MVLFVTSFDDSAQWQDEKECDCTNAHKRSVSINMYIFVEPSTINICLFRAYIGNPPELRKFLPVSKTVIFDFSFPFDILLVPEHNLCGGLSNISEFRNTSQKPIVIMA